jgi:hypothetical protein
VRLLVLVFAVAACGTGIAGAHPGDRELARRDLTIRAPHERPIPARVMLKSDVYPHDSGLDSRWLVMLIWKTDDGSPPSYYVVDSGALDIDMAPTDFMIKRFTVRARGGNALINVVWRRVGSTRTHELLELYPFTMGGRTRILKST